MTDFIQRLQILLTPYIYLLSQVIANTERWISHILHHYFTSTFYGTGVTDHQTSLITCEARKFPQVNFSNTGTPAH